MTPLALLLALAGPASAHPGHEASGFLHPFTGIDHLLAMVGVGMWSAFLAVRKPAAASISWRSMGRRTSACVPVSKTGPERASQRSSNVASGRMMLPIRPIVAIGGANAAKDGVKHANTAMLDSAHTAAQSLSAAVAAARTKLAHAIEPKKVIA